MAKYINNLMIFILILFINYYLVLYNASTDNITRNELFKVIVINGIIMYFLYLTCIDSYFSANRENMENYTDMSAVDHEAIQNAGSILNTSNLTVTNLTVTGKATIAGGASISNGATIAGGAIISDGTALNGGASVIGGFRTDTSTVSGVSTATGGINISSGARITGGLLTDSAKVNNNVVVTNGTKLALVGNGGDKKHCVSSNKGDANCDVLTNCSKNWSETLIVNILNGC
jgi:NDP-sugar pyrophosphorylase family protein